MNSIPAMSRLKAFVKLCGKKFNHKEHEGIHKGAKNEFMNMQVSTKSDQIKIDYKIKQNFHMISDV